ncbi:MAG: hypothetical protein ACFWTN_10855 [Clostridium sp.]|jgi:hypothetical protein
MPPLGCASDGFFISCLAGKKECMDCGKTAAHIARTKLCIVIDLIFVELSLCFIKYTVQICMMQCDIDKTLCVCSIERND